MSLYVDERYLLLISNRLEQFKKIRDDLWNCRCPLCGDSKKDKFKARGYFYTFNNASGLVYKCHNCNAGMSFGNFLKVFDPRLYDRYILESLRSEGKDIPRMQAKHDNLSIFEAKEDFKFKDKRLDGLKTIRELDDNNVCKQYVVWRKIPESFWDSLYYVEDFAKFTNNLLPGKIHNTEKQARLLIPYFDASGKMFAFAGRALDNNKLRYYIIKLDESFPKIYGIDRVKINQPVYCCEGQIDSMFLPNSLAVSGSSYDNEFLTKIKHNVIIVPDNDKGNPQVLQSIKKAIAIGYQVVVWPKTFAFKDINEAIMNGMSQNEIMRVINNNTYKGIMATVKLSVNQSRI